MRADREVFRRLAEVTRDGIAVDPFGRMPLEAALKDVLNEPAVKLFLLPIPATRSAPGHVVAPAPKERNFERRPLPPKAKKRPAREAFQEDPGHRKGAKGGKADGKGKHTKSSKGGKADGKGMPRDLAGYSRSTPDGRAICFGFNLGTCPSNARAGEKCDKGWHLCCMPECHADHSVQGCPWKVQ
jgi:hypothetical protein